MKLTDLMPEWVTATSNKAFRTFADNHSHVTYYHHHDPAHPEEDYDETSSASADVAQAHGIWFLCPTCFRKNGGPVGTEMVLVWFAGRPVPPEYEPKARWQVSGTSFDDLTLNPSINVDNEHWHGFIRNGEVTP